MKKNIEEHYASGKLWSTVPSKNGVRHGQWKSYYENGQLKSEGNWKEGNQDGLWKYYYENGNLEKEQVFNKNFSESLKEWDENGNLTSEEKQIELDTKNNIKYGIRRMYFKNGDLKSESKLKANKYGFFEHGSFKEYYEGNQLKCEGEFEDGNKNGKWSSYFQNGKLKKEEIFNNDICESLKEWNENGELIKENVLKNGDTRINLVHEVMTKGEFYCELKDGTEMDVFGQEHILIEREEYYEDGEWIEGDREEIDYFCLTGYEEGYRYNVSDLCKFFEIDEDNNYPEWNWNGFSDNWCGIEEEDDYETGKKKWDDYKSKFPRVTSKKQFEF